MAPSSPSMQHLLVTVGRALNRELELWTPYVPADSQSGVADLRPRAITWLVKLNDKFSFSAETLFLAVDIYDRFLHRVRVQAKYVKCIAVTCFYLAAKSVEEDDVIPGTCELVRQTECGFSTAEVLRMELCILDKLNWNLRASHTSLEFIQLFNALVLTKCPSLARITRDTSLSSLTAALLHCLSHAPLLLHPPSTLALAALSLYLERTWVHWLPATQTLQGLIQLSSEELMECRELLTHCLGAQQVSALLTPHSLPVSRGPAPSRSPLQPLRSSNNSFIPPTASKSGAQSKVAWNRSKVAPPPSLPVTPHPPAKRRKVEQDDDVYDDIRSLYDSEVSCCGGVVTLDFSASPVLSCAGQVARLSGGHISAASTQLAAG